MRTPYGYVGGGDVFGNEPYGGARRTGYYSAPAPTRATRSRREQRLTRREWRRYNRARRQGRYYPYPGSELPPDAGAVPGCAGVSYAAPFDTGDLQDELHAQALAELAGPDAAREYLAEKAAREAADGAAGVTKAIVAIGALYLMGELLWP